MLCLKLFMTSAPAQLGQSVLLHCRPVSTDWTFARRRPSVRWLPLARSALDRLYLVFESLKRVPFNVTRWLDYMLNIWPFTAINVCPITYIICQKMFNMLPNTILSLNKWPKIFKISPNPFPLFALKPASEKFENIFWIKRGLKKFSLQELRDWNLFERWLEGSAEEKKFPFVVSRPPSRPFWN